MDYNIRLDYKLPPTEESGQALVEALESFSPAAGPTEAGTIDVWFTVQASNARQAIEIGLALSHNTTDAELVGFEVVTTEEYDRRVAETPVPELLSSDEVAEMLHISRQAVGQKFAAGQLPGKRVGARTIVFARRDVETIAERQKARPGETAVEYIVRRGTEDPIEPARTRIGEAYDPSM